MVKRWDAIVLTSDPPQYPWHYGCQTCGYVEHGGTIRYERLDRGPQ